MKKIQFKAILFLLVSGMIMSCQDNLLETNIDPVNPNLPVADDLKIPSTMYSFGQGLYEPFNFPYLWFGYGYHETMGDNLVMPWGNFGGRWVNQTSSIDLDNNVLNPPPAGITIPPTQRITPPEGGDQPVEINIRNTRAAGSDNPTQYEWASGYDAIGQTNLILSIADEVDASPSEIAAIKAWALWWKAYSYNRIGLLYEEGLIVDSFGSTNNNYVPNTDIIAESNRLLGELDTVIAGVTNIGEFNSALEAMQLDIVGLVLDIASMRENSNTLKARNLVYSTSVTAMTSADWNNVITWCNSGVSSNDNAFIMKSEATWVNDAWLPGRVTGSWYFPSPRLIQDINMGDNRLDLYFEADVFPNPRGRGWQYGSNYFWKSETPIASTTPGNVTMYYAGTYEENQLFLAEAKVRTGDIEGGLSNLDAARTFQNSGLPATVGTGLTEAQALEEIRKERRLGLILRSVAFYDARRYGIASGSRTGAWVVGVTDGTYTPIYNNATINYNYLEYWPVPAFESDFNAPGTQN
ncbi:RagB/SusD family nutrient uptake outer membrane protein [Tenacibaculum jejuense]|uniref:Probable lipoprotein, SusD/RagB family n=1 Tax=Tenacibaculum jejuense TaxID=584609 RepID=A0A238UDF1_9FLAO|nr:RagB/SusD family nutrient uptake outer membrane protein [Tenacibaculum jejuense]SNR17085.1 Probable lipoprotein precursor, SusD/RagB family [Tenacibaculum jejuense]